MILAKTNFIKALQPYAATLYCGVLVGAHRGSGGIASTDVGDLQLGQTNTIWTDAFEVGTERRNTGTVEFQSSLLGSSPSLFLRGTNGAARVTEIMIGDQSDLTASVTATETDPAGIVDFTGGTVDILAGTLNVGRNSALTTTSRFGGGNGTLTWTAGTIDATTLNLGSQAANNRGNATGVVNVRSNASLIVNTATIGQDLGSASGTGNGTLNITYGGQVTISNSITGTSGTSYPGTSAINVTNGTLHLGGSVTAVGNLTLNGGKLHFLPGNTTDISAVPMTFNGNGATVDTDINNVAFASAIGNSGAGSLTKAGSGRLTLGGANTYTGGTTVSNGTLRVSNTTGSATGSGAVTVTTTGALDGTGSMAGPVTVNGTLAPGASGLGTITIDQQRHVQQPPSSTLSWGRIPPWSAAA